MQFFELSIFDKFGGAYGDGEAVDIAEPVPGVWRHVKGMMRAE